MKIFITGANGFVGRHVLDRIRSPEHQILASSKEEITGNKHTENIRWLCGDLGDFRAFAPVLRSFNPDVLIHLAWQGIPDYGEGMSRLNLDNSIALLDCVFKNTSCKKFVVSGSCSEYGKQNGSCKESDSTRLNSFFAWAKRALYDYLSLKCLNAGAALIWFRIFYVYGPGQRPGALIPTLVNAFAHKQIPAIENPGNRNDFIYVADVAEAFRLAVTRRMRSGIYNLGTGVSSSVFEVCRNVELALTGQTVISKLTEKERQTQAESNFWADMRKTTRALKWSPTTSLAQGITQYIQMTLKRGQI